MKSEGSVAWFNEKKGFGFISGQDGRDVYVDYTEIRRKGFKTLKVGERVRYTVIDEQGGQKATDVEIVEEG